jgi:hypothetical protein
VFRRRNNEQEPGKKEEEFFYFLLPKGEKNSKFQNIPKIKVFLAHFFSGLRLGKLAWLATSGGWVFFLGPLDLVTQFVTTFFSTFSSNMRRIFSEAESSHRIFFQRVRFNFAELLFETPPNTMMVYGAALVVVAHLFFELSWPLSFVVVVSCLSSVENNSGLLLCLWLFSFFCSRRKINRQLIAARGTQENNNLQHCMPLFRGVNSTKI